MERERESERPKCQFQLLQELKTTDDSEGRLKRQDGLAPYDSARHG